MERKKNNERLEFLGDAVLEISVSEYLYHLYADYNEGELTKLRSSLVCEHTLALCAREIDLGDYLKLSKGEDMTGGRERDSILSDAFEAMLGAMYLDDGIETVKKFLQKFLLDDLEDKALFYDAKTVLQEIVQGAGKEKLSYHLINVTGPDHCKEFTVETQLGERAIAKGVGKTKKAAEQMAAYQSILLLKKSKDRI